MSITRRLISGSAASWLQIGVTVLSQLILVPVYLSRWDTGTYGIWIAVQALAGLLSSADLGHKTFLSYEFLRIGQKRRSETSLLLGSGVRTGVAIGLVQIIIILVMLLTGLPEKIYGSDLSADAVIIGEAGIVLLLQGITWLFTASAGGIFVAALTAFDYYPRLAWWGVASAALTASAPAVAVSLGAGLLTAGIALSCSSVMFNLFLYQDMLRLLHREGLSFRHGSFRLGMKNLLLSLALSGKNLLENVRAAGARIILAPLAGTKGLVAFSTIRTGANFAMQGLNSITNPMMPELMKFLHQRDQNRCETAFASLWIVIVALMAPGLVILQSFIAPLFTLWTRGKVPFDAPLFALLSLTVLVYALAQPAMAIVTGNNLLKVQLRLSALAAAIATGGMCILVPASGIKGAGIALLAAEISAAVGYRMVAQRWLKDHGLAWPAHSSAIAGRSVWLAAVAMAGLILFPGAKWLILSASMTLLFLNVSKYWYSLPVFARNRSKDIICRVPGLKRFITV